MANGQQITFRVDDATYRQLLEEGASRGMSPHIMAKLVVQNRYGSRGGPTEELAGHFKRQYLARMQDAIRAATPELEALMQRLARDVLSDKGWGGPGQGGRSPGTTRLRRGTARER